jgi:hypothetical protein
MTGRVRRLLLIGESFALNGGSHAQTLFDCHVASSGGSTKPSPAKKTAPQTPMGTHVSVTQQVMRARLVFSLESVKNPVHQQA